MSCSSETSFLSAIGILTCIYYGFTLLRNLFLGIRGFVWPNRIDLVEKYGSWAVITGATDGIGLAYTKELAARKVNIVLISRTEEKLKKVSADIENEYSVKTKIIPANFSEGRPVYERIENELKHVPVGILVNNVGVYVPYPLPFTEMTNDLIWDMVNVNIAPALLMTKMILPQMKEKGKGAIINLSSMAELNPAPLIAVYSATKTFLRNFTKALQYENQGSGLTIQILSPGIVNTNMTKFSHHLLPDGLFTPTATDYAKQAIGTLGVIDHTAGYVLHSVLTTLIKPVPESWKTRFCALAFGIVRKSQKKNK